MVFLLFPYIYSSVCLLVIETKLTYRNMRSARGRTKSRPGVKPHFHMEDALDHFGVVAGITGNSQVLCSYVEACVVNLYFRKEESLGILVASVWFEAGE